VQGPSPHRLAAIALLAASAVAGAAGTAASAQEEAASVTPLEVILHLPDDHQSDAAYPLVLALHGFGASASDFDWAAPAFTRRGVILAAAQAPYTFEREDRIGRDWFRSHSNDRAIVDATVPETVAAVLRTARQLRTRFQVSELYLLGFSQGGRLTYLAAPGNHDLIDGMAIFGAGFNPDLMDAEAAARSASHQRVFIGHGTADQIELSNATAGRDYLRDAGYRVTFQSFPGGHTLPPNMIVRVVDWVLESR
jgi:phospholipase/carboxylesterase